MMYGLEFYENYKIERRSLRISKRKDENFVPFEQGGGWKKREVLWRRRLK